ncbi:unnamed protein product [Sphagnum jensenii]
MAAWRLDFDKLYAEKNKLNTLRPLNDNLPYSLKVGDQITIVYPGSYDLAAIGDKLTPYGLEMVAKLETEKKLKKAVPQLEKVPRHPLFVNAKIGDTFRQELDKTAYRVAASQAIGLSKNALVNLLHSQGESEDTLSKIGSLLDTEFGKTLLSMTLGIGLSQISTEENQPKLHKFAKECRVQSMTGLGNSIADVITNAIIEVVQKDNFVEGQAECSSPLVGSDVEDDYTESQYN